MNNRPINRKGLKMLWPYCYEDKTTWKYKDCIIQRDGKGNDYVNKWIYNDKFMFSHLDIKL